MNFYRRRPLALMLTVCIAVFAAMSFFAWWAKAAVILLVCAAAVIACVYIKRRRTSLICNLPAKAFVMLTSVLVLCSVLMTVAFYDVHAARLASLDDGRARVTVTGIKSSAPYAALYEVRLHECDSVKYRAKGLLYSETALGLAVGDAFSVDVEFVPLDDFYEFSDVSRITLLADGYTFAANTVSEIADISSVGAGTAFTRMRQNLGAKLSLYLGRDSVRLVKGIFLGEREDMGLVGRDFSYSGVLHILALSGMHLALLGSAVDKFLYKLHVPKKIRFFTVAVITAVYVAMTGFLISVVRAGIMLTVYFAACAIHSDTDRVTALLLAAWLIILVNPAAVFDVSLQLSFFATLGVILMGEDNESIRERDGFSAADKAKGALKEFFRRVLTSLGAVLFVLPLQWLYFGEISTTSVVATLILSVLCEWLLTLTMPYLIFAALGWRFAAVIFAGLIDAVCETTAHTAHFFAEHARLIWLGYPFVLPIIICTAAIIWLMAYRGASKWVYSLVPIGVACAVFLTCVLIYGALNEGRVTVDYSAQKDNDVVFIMSDGNGTVVDCTDATSASVNLIADALDMRGESELDALVLTELTRRHIVEVRKLLNKRRVGRILIPEPKDEYDMFIASDIISFAADYGTETHTYDNSEGFCELIVGDTRLTFAPQKYISRSERALLAFSAEINGVHFAYVGASSWENETVWSLTDNARYIVAGRRGPIIKSGPSSRLFGEREFVFISSESTEMFSDWLAGYSGRVRCGDRFSIIIEP